MVTEELFVYRPISVLRANVNVYERCGEEPEKVELVS